MKLTGHKTVVMLMHYVHTEDEPMRDAAELVANRRLAITGASRPMGRATVRQERRSRQRGNPPPYLPAMPRALLAGIGESNS